jgi:predicted DNA-binding protein
MARHNSARANVTAELPAIAVGSIPADSAGAPQKGRKKQKQFSKRLMLKLSRELDFRLDNLAMLNGEPKAVFALRLLEQGLRGYKADAQLRAVFAEICGQIGESEKESAA